MTLNDGHVVYVERTVKQVLYSSTVLIPLVGPLRTESDTFTLLSDESLPMPVNPITYPGIRVSKLLLSAVKRERIRRLHPSQAADAVFLTSRKAGRLQA